MKTSMFNGALLPRSNLNNTDGAPAALQWFLLIAAGVLIVALHHSLRIPLKLPGRHGLELMAILILARGTSNLRWAASLVGISAMASVLLGPASRDADAGLTAALVYVAQGVVIDLIWPRLPKTIAWGVLVGVLAGFAHAIKPLVRIAVESVTGLQFGSLVSGPWYPLMTHIAFGFVGGWAAMLALQAVKAVPKR
jgi:hypothetical protein